MKITIKATKPEERLDVEKLLSLNPDGLSVSGFYLSGQEWNLLNDYVCENIVPKIPGEVMLYCTVNHLDESLYKEKRKFFPVKKYEDIQTTIIDRFKNIDL